MAMKFKTPAANATFTITSAAEWPSVPFETDAAGAHTWLWKIAWGTYSKSGTATSPANKWDAKAVITGLGGKLTVTAKAGKETAAITVTVKGTNPTKLDADAYLATKPGNEGFGKIIEHEAKYKHFNASGEPIKSFDNGYGMCQLTTPAPTYEQVWNWKSNIDGGLALFAQKKTAAIAYLSASARTYTADQLNYEAVCRWNGGSYHVWDDATSAWVRNPDILCDTATGNIGWDMTDADNTGKTEADLRKRDKGEYASRPKGANWKYSGVCYADRILG